MSLRSSAFVPRISRLRIVLLVCVGILFASLAPPVIHAATPPPPLPSNGEGQGPMFYHGGWIQYHPKVYLVFWGPKWNTDATHIATKSAVEQILGEMGGSQYNNVLSQYKNYDPFNPPANRDVNGFVHNDTLVLGSWIDSSVPIPGLFLGLENLSGGEIKDEAVKAFNHWGLPQDKNIQILVFPQGGSTYRKVGPLDLTFGACGMHAYAPDYQLAYGWLRYAPDGQCDFTGDLAQNTAWTAVHEYAEIATDPHVYWSGTTINGSGWNTGQGVSPQEVADICENYSIGNPSPYPSYHSESTGHNYVIPYLWSNNSNACVQAEGLEFTSSVFPGKHTVQGLVLNKYQSLSGPSGWLAGPTSEETPIADGVVSYFAGGGACGGSGPNHSCGAIYYRGGSGTHVIWAGIYQKYISLGEANGWQGFPTTDELGISNGRVQYFAGGGACGGSGPSGSCSAIYFSNSTGSHIIWAGIYLKYVSLGEANGWQGFPTTDELSISNGRVQYFAGGGACGGSGPNGSCSAIYYSDQTGAHIVWAGIYQTFLHLGGPDGMLGFPTTDEQGIANGRVQYFFKSVCGSYGPNGSTSALYYLDGIGSYEVHGCIYARYASIGGPQGKMGFPVSNEYINASGYPESDFQNGYIIWQNGTAITRYFCPPAC